MESLVGSYVVNQNGDKVDVSSFAKSGAYVGLYFSAHWCPPCRGFTPMLAEFYKKFKAAGKQFEIVFVSSDRDPKSWNEYFHEMPWLALPYEDRTRKDDLSNKFGVRGIPTLIVFDGATGAVVQKDARMKVTEDPEGEDFPWSA